MTDVIPSVSIADLRREYRRNVLDESSVAADPLVQFDTWFREAQASELPEPNAMIVATVSAEGQPSARAVLLKGYGPQGFLFYTNYDSHKGRDLAANPRCALLFYWAELERQIRIEGIAERLSREASAEYFRSRPWGSQVSALASPQSEVIASRADLEARFAAIEAEYQGREVPLPENWGGYRVVASRYEFWQGRPSRRHDRIQYRLDDEARWVIERLAP